jgi:hypothetical protein
VKFIICVCAYLKRTQIEFWRENVLVHADFEEQKEYGGIGLTSSWVLGTQAVRMELNQNCAYVGLCY